MATKSMAYDHPAYTTPYVFSGSTTAGANGVTTKFAAFTAMKIKAALTTPNVASTAAGSQPLLFVKSGTATTTTTLTALTSAAITPLTNALSTAVSLTQGDQFWITHGTDATAVLSCAIETVINPGADLTA
jgi:mRNA-degrading endonuclease toxin of MazEF toxin-antitoxin module